MTRPATSGLVAAAAAYLTVLLLGYVFGWWEVRRHQVESAAYIFAGAGVAAALVRRQVDVAAGTTLTWRQHLGLAAAYAAAAALAYGETLGYGLFSDDFVLLARASSGDWWRQDAFVRPLPLAAWRMVFAAADSPAALHLLNLVLHVVNAMLVSALGSAFGLTRSAAAVAGGLFLVYPSSVETVVWPAAVHDLIVAAAALGFVQLAAGPATVARLIGAAALLAAGLLSKESAVIVPALAAIAWLRPSTRTRTAAAVGAGLAVCAVYGIVRLTLVDIPDGFTLRPTQYLLKELIARPIGTLAMPWTTSVLATRPAAVFVWTAVLIAAAAAYACRARKTVPWDVVLRCLAAAITSVLPVYAMLFITADLENGRYIYLATAFWTVAVAAFLSGPVRPAPLPALVAAAGIALAAAGVRWHLTPWREAANLRDRVLAAADAALRTESCASVRLAGAPDSVRGAYVFRNGLAEAVAAHSGATYGDRPGACALEWDGSAFRQPANPPGTIQASFLAHPRAE